MAAALRNLLSNWIPEIDKRKVSKNTRWYTLPVKEADDELSRKKENRCELGCSEKALRAGGLSLVMKGGMAPFPG